MGVVELMFLVGRLRQPAPLTAPPRHGVYSQGWEEGMSFEIPFAGQKLADRFVVDTDGISYFRGGSMVHYESKCTDPIKVALEVVQLWRDAENSAAIAVRVDAVRRSDCSLDDPDADADMDATPPCSEGVVVCLMLLGCDVFVSARWRLRF